MSLILSEVSVQLHRLDRSAQPQAELGDAGWGCEAEACDMTPWELLLSLSFPREIQLFF